MSHEHNVKNDGVFRIAFNLTLACLFSGIVIAGTWYLTNDTAEKRSAEMKTEAKKKLMPEADSFREIEGRAEWFAAFKGAEKIGYIIPAETKGYGGSMKLLVAVSPAGQVMNFSILDSRETPGLGDKAQKKPFMSQIIGKFSDHLAVTKDPSNKADVQAISGATITSRAVTKAVKEAVDNAASLTGGK